MSTEVAEKEAAETDESPGVISVQDEVYQRLLNVGQKFANMSEIDIEVLSLESELADAKEVVKEINDKLKVAEAKKNKILRTPNDQQMTLPMDAEVDESKDPKVRKAPEPRPQDHESDDTDEVSEVVTATPSSGWRERSVEELDTQPLIITSMQKKGLSTVGEVADVLNKEHADYPEGMKGFPNMGTARVGILEVAIENFVVNYEPEDGETAS